MRHACHNLSGNVIANQECSFWEINHLSKTFFGVEYCGKKQIESGSALSELLSTRIFVITVVKICCGLILTTVMMNIVVDKSTDNAEPLSIH